MAFEETVQQIHSQLVVPNEVSGSFKMVKLVKELSDAFLRFFGRENGQNLLRSHFKFPRGHSHNLKMERK